MRRSVASLAVAPLALHAACGGIAGAPPGPAGSGGGLDAKAKVGVLLGCVGS